MIDIEKLYNDLCEVGRIGSGRWPIDLIQSVRDLVEQFEHYGLDVARVPADPDPDPTPPYPAPTPEPRAAPSVPPLPSGEESTAQLNPTAQLHFERPADGSVRVTAKNAEAVPVARTLQALLDSLFGRPLEGATTKLLELAGLIEAKEIENEQLRTKVTEQAEQLQRYAEVIVNLRAKGLIT
jgi:hypothetical protein